MFLSPKASLFILCIFFGLQVTAWKDSSAK